jgi:hypothetical protein
MLRSLGHHITGSRFEKCMAGLDSTTQAAAPDPNVAFTFFIFPHLRIRFLAELHDPRPATVVRTASKIAPNSQHFKHYFCSSLQIRHQPSIPAQSPDSFLSRVMQIRVSPSLALRSLNYHPFGNLRISQDSRLLLSLRSWLLI